MFEAIIVFALLGLPAGAPETTTLIGGPFNSFGDCERARMKTSASLKRNPRVIIKKDKCQVVVNLNG